MCIKAKQRSALILRCLFSRKASILFKAFIVYVRPIWEYASSVWSLYQCNLVNMIEGIQRSFTKRLSGLDRLSYIQRLLVLNTSSLQCRRLQFDLTNYYRIINGLMDINNNDFFSFNVNTRSRGHPLRIDQQGCINSRHSNSFCKLNRVVCIWNSLPTDVVTSKTLGSFKARLALVDLNKYCDSFH